MGRFATTAELYEQFRPPYPYAFFQAVAKRLALSRQHALIDLGTGPGLLALGLAPHAGRVVGVDPELVVCASFSANDGRNPWLADYNAARRQWSDAALLSDADKGGQITDIQARLLPFSRDGVVTETLVSVADVARRLRDG